MFFSYVVEKNKFFTCHVVFKEIKRRFPRLTVLHTRVFSSTQPQHKKKHIALKGDRAKIKKSLSSETGSRESHCPLYSEYKKKTTHILSDQTNRFGRFGAGVTIFEIFDKKSLTFFLYIVQPVQKNQGALTFHS